MDGLFITQPNAANIPALNKFEYQNKEKESTFNLRRISFGARTYNASIGRFDGVDPLASIAGRFSPFVYANNNPLIFVDPDGRASEDYTYSDGYSTLSAKNSTGSVGFSGAYQNCCNNQEPIKGGYPNGTLGPASQQNATVSQSKSNNFTPEEKAAQLGVNIAWTVEGGFNLIKGGASFLRNGLKVAKNWFHMGVFNAQELKALNEAKQILKHEKLLQETFRSGVGTELKLAGRTIIVEPEAPLSGMTLFEENAFVIGKEAFSSRPELIKTVLHELYRLNTSILRGKTGVQTSVSQETAAAANFAEKAFLHVK